MIVTIENTGRIGHVAPKRAETCGDGFGTSLRIGAFGIGRREVEAFPDGNVRVVDYVGNDGVYKADVVIPEGQHKYLEIESPCLVDQAVNKLTLGFLGRGRIVVRGWREEDLKKVDKIPEWK